jgi:hypothetical protein
MSVAISSCTLAYSSSMSINLQFAKLEQRIYGLYRGPERQCANRIFRTYVHRAMLGIYFTWRSYHIYTCIYTCI